MILSTKLDIIFITQDMKGPTVHQTIEVFMLRKNVAEKFGIQQIRLFLKFALRKIYATDSFCRRSESSGIYFATMV